MAPVDAPTAPGARPAEAPAGERTGAGDEPELRLVGFGLPEAARHRLVEVGIEPLEDAEHDGSIWLISTRMGPDELREVERRIPDHDGRVLVLAHTGGERLAADLVAAGAHSIVGEGNEEAILGLVDPKQQPTALLSSFERRFGSVSAGGRGIDAATGLPDRRSFEQRVGTLSDAGDVPRVALCKVFSDQWTALQPDPVVAVQRRRLATALAHVASQVHAELYTTGPGEFGVVGPGLSTHDLDRLGEQLVAAAGMFQHQNLPLRLIIGHAGIESSSDPEELLQLARRALEVAAADGARQVLGAEDLSMGVSVTTELEAAIRLLEQVEPLLPEGRGHGERVGRMTAGLARRPGWSTAAVGRAQLAAHLHDAGRAGLPTEVIAETVDLEGEAGAAWRTFPQRSADLLRLTAGREVAATVLAQREQWNGEGFPHGIRGTEIPEAARLLAVAHAIDQALVVEQLGSSMLVQRLRERAGAELDPEIVELVVDDLTAVLSTRA